MHDEKAFQHTAAFCLHVHSLQSMSRSGRQRDFRGDVLCGIEEMLNYEAWYLGHWHINKRIDKLHFLMHGVEMMID